VFFGLSGTGKTTLSADPTRRLIGDDEHGWSDRGVFNFEGGCYAKVIRLSASGEPEIHAATQMFGTVLENVVLDLDDRSPMFDEDTITENTRASYPIHFIPNHEPGGQGGHPKTVIFLTADAFGVLPPIARLTPRQAMYHFLSGYTAKVAGTERGVTEPTATFSACFGAPFLPRHPGVYAKMLGEKIAACYRDAYVGEPFVRVLEGKALPDTKNVVGTNVVEIAWRLDPRTGRLLVMSAEDNLVKGAGGQAVQSLNLVCGFPETTGLV